MGSKKKPFVKGSALTKKGELALIEKLVPETHFSELEMKYLIQFFKKHSSETAYIEKSDFLEMLHEVFGYTEHFFMNRVFLQADTNKDGRTSMEEFIRLMSILLRGSKEEKIRFCFNCYDLNETMQLSRDVIITLLNQTSTEAMEANPDLVLDLLEMILKKMDQDGDGVLIFEEFKNAALEDWLLLEAFGQCFPDYECHVSFLEKMGKN
ncbi:EF-hand calcium-binding domain-containing protein 1 [Nephila pilipes]|uniref:EF-hand calcium-binding domain-containing protein 1 n=1 Tax=Nephila pilipes TaxID=299642 RepID=A0A8X6TV15_NEPPI|nr:EF-hand calcium-binding domain-containing protein 1 [Nephila pilipes]